MTVLSEGVHIGDLLKYETPAGFCREKLTLKAATAQSIKIGSLLRDSTGYILVANGQEANVTAIALEAVEAVGAEKIMCLVRGPAIIDKDRLSLETGVTWTEVAAPLEALGIIDRSQATQYTEGPPEA